MSGFAGLMLSSFNPATALGYDDFIAIGSQNSPFLNVYGRSGNTFTRIANPANLPTRSYPSNRWNANNTSLAVATNASPYVIIYNWDSASQTFTKINDANLPSTLSSGAIERFAWSPDGVYLAIAFNGGTRLQIWKRSGDTFTKLADPGTMPAATNGMSVAWDSTGTRLAVASEGTGTKLIVYNRSGDTFTAVAAANINNTPTVTVQDVAWYGDSVLACAFNSSPYFRVWNRSGNTYTSIADPASLPTSVALTCEFNPDGTKLAIGTLSSPFLFVYNKSGDSLTRITTPSTSMPAVNVYDLAWNRTGAYMAVGAASNGSTIYSVSGDTFTNLGAVLPSWGSSGGAGPVDWTNTVTTPPAETDPYWNNVELLITGGASNGSSTIVDSSKNGLSTNVNSGVTYSNSVTKFASTSLAFTGTTNYFGYAAQTALNSSGGDFTWEGWLYLQTGTNYPTFVAYGAYSQLLMFVNGTSGTGSWRWEMDDDGAAALDYGVAGSAPTYNQWDHYAITRASNVVRFFKNGVLMGTATSITQNAVANQALAIGSYQNAGGGNFFKGYMEQIRFTKGVARYTAAFNPPTTAFPTSGS